MNPTATGESTLTLSLSSPESDLVRQAAASSGQSIDHFARTALMDKAHEVTEAETVRVLSHRDALRFVEMLDSEIEPNEALKRAATCYRNRNE